LRCTRFSSRRHLRSRRGFIHPAAAISRNRMDRGLSPSYIQRDPLSDHTPCLNTSYISRYNKNLLQIANLRLSLNLKTLIKVAAPTTVRWLPRM
jgi:hypothetical protein